MATKRSLPTLLQNFCLTPTMAISTCTGSRGMEMLGNNTRTNQAVEQKVRPPVESVLEFQYCNFPRKKHLKRHNTHFASHYHAPILFPNLITFQKNLKPKYPNLMPINGFSK